MPDGKANETEGVEMVKLVVARGFFKAENKIVVRLLIGKPSTNGLLLHTHNIL